MTGAPASLLLPALLTLLLYLAAIFVVISTRAAAVGPRGLPRARGRRGESRRGPPKLRVIDGGGGPAKGARS